MSQHNDVVSIDLSNYKDKVGARVLPGTYKVIVDDAEPDTSAAGNPMINIWFKIVGGEFDGATLTDRLVLTEKSLFRVVGFMQAIGMPTPKKRLSVRTSQFIGKILNIEVDDGEPYNGRVKSEVRSYLRIAGQQQQESEDLPEPGPEVTAAADMPESVNLDDVDLG